MVFDEDEWQRELRELRREGRKTLWSGVGMGFVLVLILCYLVFK